MRFSLLNSLRTRRRFDPSKAEDLKELKQFVETNQWINGCPFYLEDEWDNIPVMCMHKYAKHMLSKVKVA
jgi:hypothetical protein